tara:strand:- start:238 stop:897 length:660 start_codon:yes stop_codon:yes gene_type:complete
MAKPQLKKPPSFDWASISALISQLGLWGTMRIGLMVAVWQAKGEPFSALPKPKDLKEKYSRMQIGPAILAYRALDRLYGKERALEVVEQVILAGGASFLKKSLGPLTQSMLKELSPPEREEFVQLRSQRFFNMTMEWNKIDVSEVKFTVSHCHFPHLSEAAGCPELAPMFCKTDEVYFGNLEKTVNLDRPHTLATGGPNCPFTLKWAPSEQQPQSETDS